jgi:hypothetical protein
MLVLNGSASIADVVALADRREQVSVSARVVEAVDHAHQVAADLSTRFPIYGRTTGVGANRTTSVSPTDTEYGMRLLRSHAVDAGDPLDDRTVRAMLAVRLVQLCVPGAGLDPKVLSGLETMLNEDALPELRQYASIGTGDLAPLAGTALTLIGERPASKPLTPMEPWGADSALPFMSSSALTVGRGCLALDELSRLERASSLIYVLSSLRSTAIPKRCHRLQRWRRRPHTSTPLRVACAHCWRRKAGRIAGPLASRIPMGCGCTRWRRQVCWRRCIRWRDNSSGHSTPRRRIPSSTSRTTPSSITAPSIKHRCHSNWTAPLWRLRLPRPSPIRASE